MRRLAHPLAAASLSTAGRAVRLCRRYRLAILLAALLFGAAPAAAGQHLYQVGLDTDEASTTGCSLDLGAEGSQAGFEKLVELRVDPNYSPPVVAPLQLVSCVSGEWDFENAEELSQGGWNAGIDTGEGGSDFIEGFVPIASLGFPPTAQVAVKATAVSGAVDGLVNSGAPIKIPEPAAAWAALAVLAVVLALGSRRRSRAMRAAALVLVFCVVVRPGYAEPTPSDLSGSAADWTGISPVADDAAGDASDPRSRSRLLLRRGGG